MFAALVLLGAMIGRPPSAAAQSPTSPGAVAAAKEHAARGSAGVDSLVAAALVASPTLRAARARVDAARARVFPAGLRPDPMLMAGIQNLPLSGPKFADEMTMKMIGVGQTILHPGKLSAGRRLAEREVEAAQAAVAGVAGAVGEEVRGAYYELAFLDRALAITARNRDVLVSVIGLAEARYGTGAGGQQDVLRARVEAGRLAETAVALTERRRAELARLNAALDRASESPVDSVAIPKRIVRAAVADSASEIRFVSASLGARASDSPLPPLADLQALALRENPSLRESDAMVAAQAERTELARLAPRPDLDVSLQYGQRNGFTDMVSAVVTVPLPLQARRKQGAQAVEARAALAALDAERHARRNDVFAEVARMHSELERDRAQLALYVRSIIPQGRAALASATASYRAGRAEFLTLLDNQATLFSYEMEYFRLLSGFATTLAALERVVGREVLP